MNPRLPYLIWRAKAWMTPLIDVAFALVVVALCYGASELLSNLFD